jgi:hypothetical protein
MSVTLFAKIQFGMQSKRIALGLMVVIMVLAGCASHVSSVPPPSGPEAGPGLIKPLLPAIQFTIQVGAFSTSERAARYADTLQAAGLDAFYFIDTDGLCKVRFERFDTKQAALNRASALKSQGVIGDFYIVWPHPESTLVDPEVALQESLVETARRFVGTAYRWGGDSLKNGFDCSGLAMTVYRLNGLELPHSSHEQYRLGTPVAREELRGGDLVFFATSGGNRISHVGIYSGQNRFIHAPSRGKDIRSTPLSNSYFKARYKGARRYY